MSEKLSIQEAGKSRNFSGVGVIETETPEGDSCFWVPESERELESGYVFSNGTYRPRKYGFSDIDVDVFDISTDLDGNDWKIEIPDIGFPDITLDPSDLDIDFTIDGIGNIDIHIPGGDPDDWPGWDDDPEGKEDFDDWIDDGNDPDDWPGWDDDPEGKEDFDDWINDEDYTFDPSEYGIDPNSDIDTSLDVDGMGNISADISGIDLDGLPVGVDIDLGDLSIDIAELPDEIRIMHVPDKTRYKEGEEIDIEGIVVQAYRGGEVWDDPDGKYVDGYIPVHELIASYINCNVDGSVIPDNNGVSSGYNYQYKNECKSLSFSDYYKTPSNNQYLDGNGSLYSSANEQHKTDQRIRRHIETSLEISPIGDIRYWFFFDGPGRPYITICSRNDNIGFTYKLHSSWKYNEEIGPYKNIDTTITGRYLLSNGIIHVSKTDGETIVERDISSYTTYTEYEGDPIFFIYNEWFGDAGLAIPYPGPGSFNSHFDFSGWIMSTNMPYVYVIYPDPFIKTAHDILYFDEGGSTQENYIKSVAISWPRPHDSQLLAASFDITVEENDGAAQSNEESSDGHWGGTTISGDNGGSHSRGKF